jgi:abhydrolase domain-containing protein 12
MTWLKDLDVPGPFSFLSSRVTPFFLESSDREKLYTWHIPVELYHKLEVALLEDPVGFVSDITDRHGFEFLCEDTEARLILHCNETAGIVGSGYKVPNCRVKPAIQARNIHVLKFECRGFGRGRGKSHEHVMLLGPLTSVDRAMKSTEVLLNFLIC